MDVQPAGLEQGRVAYRGKIRFGDINLRFEINDIFGQCVRFGFREHSASC